MAKENHNIDNTTALLGLQLHEMKQHSIHLSCPKLENYAKKHTRIVSEYCTISLPERQKFITEKLIHMIISARGFTEQKAYNYVTLMGQQFLAYYPISMPCMAWQQSSSFDKLKPSIASP